MSKFPKKSTALFVRFTDLAKPACSALEHRYAHAAVILSLFVLTAFCEQSLAGTIVSDEAYYLALETSGKLIAPQGLAERIDGDLALIRKSFPIVSDIHDSVKWQPGQIRIGLSDIAYRDFQAGSYHKLDSLLNTFGASVHLPTYNYPGDSYVEVDHDTRYNPERLSELFTSVEGVTSAEANYLLYFENPDQIKVSGNQYTFTPGWNHYLPFPVCGRRIQLRGTWTFVVEGGTAYEIPEPSSAALVLIGIPFGGLYLARRRYGAGWASAAIALMVVTLTAIPVHAGTATLAKSWPKYSVIPVLFSPTDWSIDSAEVQSEAAAIRSAMHEIQTFYADNLGGRSFHLNDLEVVQGNGPKENYHINWNGKNIYQDGVEFDGNMEAAVVEELYAHGYPTPPNQDVDGYSVVIFMKGAGGWAGGGEFGNADGGWAILGDWAIDSLQGAVQEGEYWWSGRRLQIGATAHELGHTFGLPHPDFYSGDFESTVMGNWWNYPTVGLNTWDQNHLLTEKASFFVPEPSAVLMLGIVPLGLVLLTRRSECPIRRTR